MPIRLVNTCEEGAVGAIPELANNGRRSGDGWGSVSATTTTSNTQYAHGTKSIKINVDTSASLQGVTWPESIFTVSTATTVYMRFYFRLESLPSVVHRWITVGSAIGTNYLGGLLLKADGTFDLSDANVTGKATSQPLSLNQWYRLEMQLVSNATTGSMTVKLFTGGNLEGTVPDQTISYTNQNTNGAPAQWFNFGGSNSSGTFGMWLDSIEVNDLGYPGPFAPPVPTQYETLFANGQFPFMMPFKMNDYADTSTYTMGMYFTPAVNGKVYGGAWCNHFNATSAEGSITPDIALYPGPSGGTTAIATKSTTVTEVRGNWNYDLFNSPIPVTAGTTYMIAVRRKGYPYDAYFFDASNGGHGPQTQGNLTAGDVTTTDNNFFGTGGLGKPASAFHSTWYGLDVLFKADVTESWGVPID